MRNAKEMKIIHNESVVNGFNCSSDVERNRFEGAMEMAGAMAHELNQVLQQFLGYSDLLSDEADRLAAMIAEKEELLQTGNHTESEKMEILDNLRHISGKLAQVSEKMGAFTRKMSMIRQYRTREYLPGRVIFDIDAALCMDDEDTALEMIRA